jgi:hypothetical protein
VPARPLILASSVLAIIGGLLIGLIGIASAIYVGAFVSPVAGWAAQFFAILAMIDGVALVILGLGVWTSRYGQLWIGVTITVLSTLTLFVGTVFLPGVVLCVLGGILAVLHESRDEHFVQSAESR